MRGKRRRKSAEQRSRLTTSLGNATVLESCLISPDHCFITVLLPLVKAELALAAGAGLRSNADASTNGVSGLGPSANNGPDNFVANTVGRRGLWSAVMILTRPYDLKGAQTRCRQFERT